MALYAIADLHLPLGIDKPMDKFGSAWANYVERLAENWQHTVKPYDTVMIPGDFSWATYLEQSIKDFEFLNNLNGRKIISKGNHDYWWTTMSKLGKFVSDFGFENIMFMQNNSYVYDKTALCGTRGWLPPECDKFTENDRKIFDREVLRLELSLKQAQKKIESGECDEIYVFLPVNSLFYEIRYQHSYQKEATERLLLFSYWGKQISSRLSAHPKAPLCKG